VGRLRFRRPRSDPEAARPSSVLDPAEVDADALGLTFSHEVDTLGARATVELRPGGSFQQVRERELPWFIVGLPGGRPWPIQ